MGKFLRYSDAELAAFRLSREKLPAHIAMIMDGNGRWAQRRGLPRSEGHRRGVKTVRMAIEECSRLGLEQLTLYCLSSENWKRPKRELEFLLSLLEQYLVEERAEIMREGLRFSMIGRREGLTPGVLREVDKTVACSRNHTGLHLCLAVNYGSRSEILDAVKRIAGDVASGRVAVGDLTEQHVSDALYTAGMPDPDLLVRTAGEMRVSNYLLWQISYSELWVTSRFWPEFGRDDLFSALRDYALRDRRFGGVKG